ncbi:MAG: hydrogenase maturation nickel metallochaperone HypA [Vicinamibacterales bacterium]|nr:hydrogenase maturation nickel metallochaperone HypA [Vicinamibacterales bacterium]
MHEYSIVQALMERIEEQARAHRASSVSRVSVRIGELSGVEPDLLRTAFELVRERTICDGATLQITSVAARWVCRACGRDVAAGGVLRCADCGAPARLAQGDEILLEQLELEVADV